MELTESIVSSLRCPACKNRLNVQSTHLKCIKCKQTYPIIAGVPVLIHEASSVFKIEEIIKADGHSNDSLSQCTKELFKIIQTSISAN